jgi:hypothetical protein
MINFMNGQPSANVLPTKLFAQAALKAFSRPNAANDVLQVNTKLCCHCVLLTFFI